METDGGITLVRERRFRAVLTCTTCRTVVAIGPELEQGAMSAYELGQSAGFEGPKHLGTCAGGALAVTIEEIPNPAPSSSPPTPALRIVR